MELSNKHIGFIEENAPETIIWSDSSFVKAVHPNDRRKHGFGDFILALLSLSSFVAGLIFAASKDLSNAFESHSRLFFIMTGIGVIMAGLLIGMFRNDLMKQVMLRKIKSRPELLFQPDPSCYYVGIENPSTYSHKLKKHAEDYGLLNITGSQIQLEMLTHRAQFKSTELIISRISAGDELGCIKLTSILSPNPWSIAVIPQGLPDRKINLSSSKAYSQQLYRRLIVAGVQTAENEANVTFV